MNRVLELMDAPAAFMVSFLAAIATASTVLLPLMFGLVAFGMRSSL